MLCFPKLISHFPMPLFRLPEYKIGIFVRFLPSEPSFSGFLSTKSVFLCQKEQFSPGFCPFRAQNRHFCALLPSETPIFGLFEHKIGRRLLLEASSRWCARVPEK